jgi:hypothetical protein
MTSMSLYLILAPSRTCTTVLIVYSTEKVSHATREGWYEIKLTIFSLNTIIDHCWMWLSPFILNKRFLKNHGYSNNHRFMVLTDSCMG